MKTAMRAGGVALLLAMSATTIGAQERPAAKPAATAPTPSRSLVIAPPKPVVAPGVAPGGDSGAVPTAARGRNARTVSVSARQAAEQTVAALVAAMKNLPKRPPAPPESRAPRASRAGASARAQAMDAPTPILYHVTWPATPDEPGLDRRVELDWSTEPTDALRLRWNEPQP